LCKTGLFLKVGVRSKAAINFQQCSDILHHLQKAANQSNLFSSSQHFSYALWTYWEAK